MIINTDKRKKYIFIASVLVAIVLVIFGLTRVMSNKSTSSGTLGEQVEIAAPKAKIDLNKEFSFPLLNDKGQEISSIRYVIENAELQDEIIVKGQKATSVKGKTFLIVNLKVTNEYNKAITINTRDYIRLVVNGNDKELLAPEIHNDPVEVLAISTKYTRVGFTISDSDQSLKLKIGEITSDKTDVDLNFGK